jgi:hypothetical protein
MSKQKSKKQLKKQKLRERSLRKDRKSINEKRRLKCADRQIRRIAPLPEFEIDTDDAVADIEAMVLGGIKAFKGRYARLVNETTLSILADHYRFGWTDLVNSQAADITDLTREQVERSCARWVESELGNGILRSAPSHLVRRSLPTSCFALSLFTRHAVLQLADRIVPDWKLHYLAQLYVFGFFYECVYFEEATLYSGQPAIVIYNSCLRAGEALRKFMRELLDVKTDNELKDHYYVVGYCPLLFDGSLAIAKTFLTPGYRQTPERATMKKSGRIALMRDVEMASDDGINVVTASTCEKTRAAIRWFHEHGVEQVKKLDHEVFRDMSGPFGWEAQSAMDLTSPTQPS